jgi:LCP family protein required for cell wall assembly
MTDTGPEERSRWRPIGIGAALVTTVALMAGAVVVSCQARRPSNERPAASGASTPTPTPSASPTASPTPQPGAQLTGPLNILLVGVDTRVGVPGWEPHGDAVLIMQVTKDLRHAYLFSLPRDLVVDIPAFPKAQFPGERTKLTHAMSYGSRVPGKRNAPNTAQGYELLAATVSRYTGIPRFDAGGVITFNGFDHLVDALGGVDLYIDQRVVSQHRRPDGTHRAGGANGYVGPQMVYEKGQRHLSGWQALDYARQRYTAGGDYARQRHQQQLIRAIVQKILSQDLARDPDRLDQVVRALGETLTFDGRGQRVIDFAFALSGLSANAITMVALPGHGVGSGGGYRGEELDQVARQFLTALRTGRVDAFLAANPRLVVRN